MAQGLYELGDDSQRVQSEQTDFKNNKDAVEYARKKILNALHAKEPHEYLVFVSKSNNILGEFSGDKSSVGGNLKYYDYLKMFLPNAGYSSYHGHPAHDGLSTTISFDDFYQLNDNNGLEEVVVFNNKGEYSKIKKKKSFKPQDYKHVNKLFRKLYKDVQKEAKTHSRTKTEPKEEDIEQYLVSLDGIKQVHEFWQNNASKLDIEYETNYSYLE